MPNICKAIFQFLANFETYRAYQDPGSDFKEVEWQGGNQYSSHPHTEQISTTEQDRQWTL